MQSQVHEFHIPVMGTGFTLATPLYVARYGISSVVSLVDDVLIEQMRRLIASEHDYPYEPIASTDPDSRAERIRCYLDMLHDLIEAQMDRMRGEAFAPGTDLTRYFRLLPDGVLKRRYEAMLRCTDDVHKLKMQQELRGAVVPGEIDVNIMTKLDRMPQNRGLDTDDDSMRDAMSALRGFARSRVRSSVVFSAGLNNPLYSALADYRDFFPDESGESAKKVILKVSDYRSALIQGRYLAKKGIWVSEFRIESGLNCGGHAFATQGLLLGPILHEFTAEREALVKRLHRDYAKALHGLDVMAPAVARRIALTVQGGIGSHEEHLALLQYYRVDRTGWATPFLLVPEATDLDDEHIERLIAATEADVSLSDSSPLGIPFWTLNTSSSEVEKRRRIEVGDPGSPCPKGLLELDDELGDRPLCRASKRYIRLKLAAIDEDASLSEEGKAMQREQVLSRACICHELGGGALMKLGIQKQALSAICPSLNIAHFKARATLEEMTDHIYGRISLIKDQMRPHMFIRELAVYVDYFTRELERFRKMGSFRKLDYYEGFKRNLLEGIDYYQGCFREFVTEQQDRFASELMQLKSRLENIRVEA